MPDTLNGNGHSVLPELLWQACDAMMVIDERRRILAVNPAMEQLTGRKKDDLVGRAECGIAFACQDLQGCSLAEHPWECPGLRAMRNFEPVRGAEYVLQIPPGKKRIVSSSYTPIQMPGRPVWALVILRDISQQKLREMRLVAQAKTDPLTALPNRTAFMENLRKELKRADRHGRPLAVAMADVDNFKEHNDRFGHLAGDDLLKSLARLLHIGRRLPDLVARYGGDEFVLLLPETDAAGAMVVAERFCNTVAHFPFPQREAAGALPPLKPIGISVGVAVFPADGGVPQQLLLCADKRLYEAKHLGGNRAVGPT